MAVLQGIWWNTQRVAPKMCKCCKSRLVSWNILMISERTKVTGVYFRMWVYKKQTAWRKKLELILIDLVQPLEVHCSLEAEIPAKNKVLFNFAYHFSMHIFILGALCRGESTWGQNLHILKCKHYQHTPVNYHDDHSLMSLQSKISNRHGLYKCLLHPAVQSWVRCFSKRFYFQS